MMNASYFVLFITSLCLSAGGAWCISNFGHQLDLLDRPNDRSSHYNLTPKGGGIGILAAFITASIALGMPVSFWIPAAILSILSLIGDRFEISPLIRLLFQFAASIIFILGLLMTPSSPFWGYLMILPISIFMVGTTNTYNFMDGINGIAGIAGAVGFGLVAFFGYHFNGSTNLIALNTSLAFCCMGFLPFNVPKAKVFLGDVGSILLGFVFAAMVLCQSRNLLDFVCLTGFLFPFYADEITTGAIRLKNREKIWRPHRKHLYQLLANEYNISHWKISLGYGIAQLFVGASILYILKLGLSTVVAVFFLYFVAFSVISLGLRKRLTQTTGI